MADKPKDKHPGKRQEKRVRKNKFVVGKKNTPPSNRQWHKVKTGETLESIAGKYAISPKDLIRLNWDTDDDLIINWYLVNYVGCTEHDGQWYSFTSDDTPGRLLVPIVPDLSDQSNIAPINVGREADNLSDTTFRVGVLERLPDYGLEQVSGKWLYVFSGQGVDFGYAAPSLPKSDPDLPAESQPAFSMDFTGVHHITKPPDTLEYEIKISSEKAASQDTINDGIGKGDNKPEHEFKKWYFISNPDILSKWQTESRDKRTTHAFRDYHSVTIDLAPGGKNKRFYFLLSPVQLGPKAIEYAMKHPNGLTPLLKSDVSDPGKKKSSEPDAPKSKVLNLNVLKQNVGPKPEDVERNPAFVSVIDPYAWAKNLAEKGYVNGLMDYQNWLGKGRDEATDKLKDETGWSPDHLFVAETLKLVQKSHPDPQSIKNRMKGGGKEWEEKLKKWEKDLDQRHAEITAAAHRKLLQLIEWMDGDAHRIIETAIIHDTTAGSSEDALDIATGITHWAICTEHMFALEPGVVFLREVLNHPGTVATDILLKHLQDLDKDAFVFNVSEMHKVSFRYGREGLMSLVATAVLISSPPSIQSGLTQDKRLAWLAEHNWRRRDNIIKFLNDLKIFPVMVKAPPTDLFAVKEGLTNYGNVSAATSAFLDFGDKFSEYVINKDISIPRRGRILNKLADWEEALAKRPKIAGKIRWGFSWGVKGTSLGFSTWNIYNTITTARHDYQTNESTVSPNDWLGVTSASTMAIQDLLSTIAAMSKNKGFQEIFPQLMVTEGGQKWKYGIGAARVTGIAGITFAAINVLAMLISGVTTMITMYDNAKKAYSRGDYWAVGYYSVGILGGGVMVTGAVVFGIAVIKAGLGASSTGIGATVGIVLFFVGGIIVLLGSLGGSNQSSDDYQVFAQKCFLGLQSDEDPIFSDDSDEIPKWSHAPKSGRWGIKEQKRAIINLLGRFQLKTIPSKNLSSDEDKYVADELTFEIKPGFFPLGSSVSVELYYENNTHNTLAVVHWDKYENDTFPYFIHSLGHIEKGNIFDAEETNASFYHENGVMKKITIWVKKLSVKRYVGAGKEELLATVTIRYPYEKYENVIRTRKLVIKPFLKAPPSTDFPTEIGPESLKSWKIDKDEVISNLFE